MSWLLHSMEPETSSRYLLIFLLSVIKILLNQSSRYLLWQTAKEIWDVVAPTYGQKENLAQVYDLKCLIHKTKQRDWPLTRNWTIINFQLVCTTNTATFKGMIEQNHILEFLAELNLVYDPIRI